ncbi:atrial natriuretic peptide receptor 1-like [Acanthaster planci]|uniref:Guanylate cyclase n=1 Tax=Acanthaster planci TaxID=133434 RepID=A0A8B7XXZ9_ACAPL|nr:atrial natriuretic peptide receptor 1-like [Acanthaster planci]
MRLRLETIQWRIYAMISSDRSTLVCVCILWTVLDPSVARKINLGLLFPWEGSNPVGSYGGGAAAIAVDKVNSEGRQEYGAIHAAGLEFDYIWRDTNCETKVGLPVFSDLHYENELGVPIDAYIGPGCSIICEPGGILAAHWGTPVVSWGCTSDTLSQKETYPTFARTTSPSKFVAPFFTRIMQHFGYDRVAIIYSSHHLWSLTAQNIKTDLEENGIMVSVFGQFEPLEKLAEANKANIEREAQNKKKQLEDAKERSRVFIIIAYGTDVRNFLLDALDLGMTDGTYAFFTTEVSLNARNDVSQTNDGRDDDAIRAFEGLMDVKLLKPETDAFKAFEDEVRNRTSQMPFNSTVFVNNPDAEIVIEAALLYDAVLLYAGALNRSLNAENSTDGRTVSKYLFTNNFTGIDGEVVIDESGDRHPNLMLQNLFNEQFTTVANYFNNEQKYVDLNRTIYWPGGGSSPPANGPECGWDNVNCMPALSTIELVFVIVASVVTVVVACIVAFFVYRNRKYEAELRRQVWKINFDDIVFSQDDHMRRKFGTSYEFSMGKFSSQISDHARIMDGSAVSLFSANTFTKVGRYQGAWVAIKPLNKPSVNINREILKEFKQLRDLQHTNVNPFLGACVEPPNLCIIYKYCSRGSLQDVLNNDHIKLDYLFKWSFAMDVAKGLNHLHSSPIQSHGNLRSTNCLVDSRWVCKISDFGLVKLRDGAVDNRFSEEAKFARNLTTAPELLNLERPPLQGTQSGDCYSYGILLQEIFLRDSPYCMVELSARDIIKLVKACKDPPFRPVIPESVDSRVVRLMQSCWAADPEARPSIASAIKKLQQCSHGRKGNLIDNMVDMMEKYTDQLEEMVEERTKQLEEEKKRTDELLYEILPRSVADELKQGKSVEPVSFPAVTVFFSDIVGFTRLAAASSPMQVIDLLNNLYTGFDSTIENYDVYKVETIGDAYMVASGLPVRNGDKHAGEICTMALDLLSFVKTFHIAHKPEEHLQLRIGVHTGPVVAGVVGKKMPRYCLFGDTVNYASRMESSGLALRIHVSPECRDILEKLGKFYLERRGSVQMKGKGTIETFFLVGKDGFTKELPSLTTAVALEDHEFK